MPCGPVCPSKMFIKLPTTRHDGDIGKSRGFCVPKQVFLLAQCDGPECSADSEWDPFEGDVDDGCERAWKKSSTVKPSPSPCSN